VHRISKRKALHKPEISITTGDFHPSLGNGVAARWIGGNGPRNLSACGRSKDSWEFGLSLLGQTAGVFCWFVKLGECTRFDGQPYQLELLGERDLLQNQRPRPIPK